MAANDVLKNFALFVDGRGYAGQTEEFNPPELAIMAEAWRGAGMDGSVSLDMGMDGVMQTTFSLLKYDRDALVQFGLAEGGQVQLTARGALESYDGTITSVIIKMRGKITKVARATWKPGTLSPVTFTMDLNYYYEEHGGQPVYEFDIINMVRRIDGVDRLAEMRAAMGI